LEQKSPEKKGQKERKQESAPAKERRGVLKERSGGGGEATSTKRKITLNRKRGGATEKTKKVNQGTSNSEKESRNDRQGTHIGGSQESGTKADTGPRVEKKKK